MGRVVFSKQVRISKSASSIQSLVPL
jgi:hypothetical protein